MYDTLTTLLLLALACNQGHDKKKRKKIALGLLGRVAYKPQQDILRPVINASDFEKEVFHQADRHDDLKSACHEASLAGYPGMVIVGNVGYPCAIVMRSAVDRAGPEGTAEEIEAFEQEILEDREWLIQNEVQLQAVAARAAADMLGTDSPLFEVVFFRNRGFSGITSPYLFEKQTLTHRLKRKLSKHTVVPQDAK